MIEGGNCLYFGEFTEIVIREIIRTRKRVLPSADWKVLLAQRIFVNVERKRGYDGKKHNPNLTSEELFYYRRVWGFDPIQDRVFDRDDTRSDTDFMYYYQAQIPLENDPILNTKGLTMYVRVEADVRGNSYNKIVFKSDSRKAHVHCASNFHYLEGSTGFVPVSEKDYSAFLKDFDIPDEPRLPWEHFAALKSFAAGMSTIGLLNLIQTFQKYTEDDQPIVGPSLMTEIIHALSDVDPSLIERISRDHLHEIFDLAPVKWIVKRWQFLFMFSEVDRPFEDKKYLASVSPATRKKLLDIYFRFSRKDVNGWDYYLSHNREEFLDTLLTADFIAQLDLRTVDLVLDEIERSASNKSRLEKQLENRRRVIFEQEHRYQTINS